VVQGFFPRLLLFSGITRRHFRAQFSSSLPHQSLPSSPSPVPPPLPCQRVLVPPHFGFSFSVYFPNTGSPVQFSRSPCFWKKFFFPTCLALSNLPLQNAVPQNRPLRIPVSAYPIADAHLVCRPEKTPPPDLVVWFLWMYPPRHPSQISVRNGCF